MMVSEVYVLVNEANLLVIARLWGLEVLVPAMVPVLVTVPVPVTVLVLEEQAIQLEPTVTSSSPPKATQKRQANVPVFYLLSILASLHMPADFLEIEYLA
jgi:hypothetical protein